MIYIDSFNYLTKHFPDGTQMHLNLPIYNPKDRITIRWEYESDEELVTLWYIVNHYRQNFHKGGFTLEMPYVPNARMDRVHSETEIFTLKHFCNLINLMQFDRVEITDPHSNVTPALLNNVVVHSALPYVVKTLLYIAEDEFYADDKKEIVIYFPDYGAYHKYHEEYLKKIPAMLEGTFAEGMKVHYIYGKKVREWETGKILGLEIANEQNIDLTNKVVLMADDIISYGGTMYYGAKKLKEMGAGTVYAYATHVEKSVTDKEKGTLLRALNDKTVEKLFHTDSLYPGYHERIVEITLD